MRRAIAAFLVALCAGGCSSSSDGGEGEPGGPGPQDGPCTGEPWGCRDIALKYPLDVAACGSQHGCGWDFEYDQCGGNPFSCADMPDHFACVRQVGCAWNDGGGKVESSLLTGECQGTPTPCPTYTDQPTCNHQPACQWGFSAGCETDFSEVSDGYTCAQWSVDDIGSDGHPAVNIERCDARDGCTWVGDRYAE